MSELKSNEDITNESVQEMKETNAKNFFTKISPEEKNDFARRLKDFEKLSTEGGMLPRKIRKGMFKFRDELIKKYEFPRSLNLDILSDDSISNVDLFNFFEKYGASGLSSLQIESTEQADRVEKSREAAERAKKALAGLKCEPVTLNEVEKLMSIGLAHKDKDGITILDSRKIKQDDISVDGISSERLAKIQEREESINYLLSSFRYNRIEKKDLLDARYFTIAELVERKQEAVNLLRCVKEEIQSHELPQESLQILYDKYKFQDNELFDVEDKTGKVILKPLDEKTMQEVQNKISVSIESHSVYRDRFARVFKKSRTGIDPGVLIVSDDRRKLSYQVGLYGGIYYPGRFFQAGLDLAETGLIALPTVITPGVLEHEYAHFEDHMFGGGKRTDLDSLIGEINSFLLDEADGLLEKRPDLIFERMKGIINTDYLKKIKPESMSLKEARSKINRTVDVLHKLYDNGFSKEAISSILMQSDKFDGILQWEKVNSEELKKIAGKSRKKQKNRRRTFY